MDEIRLNTFDELIAYLKPLNYSQRNRLWVQESEGIVNVIETTGQGNRIIFSTKIESFIFAFFDCFNITLQAYNPIIETD